MCLLCEFDGQRESGSNDGVLAAPGPRGALTSPQRSCRRHGAGGVPRETAPSQSERGATGNSTQPKRERERKRERESSSSKERRRKAREPQGRRASAGSCAAVRERASERASSQRQMAAGSCPAEPPGWRWRLPPAARRSGGSTLRACASVLSTHSSKWKASSSLRGKKGRGAWDEGACGFPHRGGRGAWEEGAGCVEAPADGGGHAGGPAAAVGAQRECKHTTRCCSAPCST